MNEGETKATLDKQIMNHEQKLSLLIKETNIMLRDAIMEEQKRRRAIAMVLVLCYCASVGWALIRNKDISRRIEEIVSSVCQKISTPIVD